MSFPYLGRIVRVAVAFSVFASALPPTANSITTGSFQDVLKVGDLLREKPEIRREAIHYLELHWQDSFVPMLLEVLTFRPNPNTEYRILKVLKAKTNQKWGRDIDSWFRWWWSEDREEHPYYRAFKTYIYSPIDRKFARYFSNKQPAKIRLDEVRWGGVTQDGIPPLRVPKMVSAEDARYLRDGNVVFGLEVRCTDFGGQ